MSSLSAIYENLHFLILEVLKQVDDTRKVIKNPNQSLVEKILDRDDHIDNLKNRIENKCFSALMNRRTRKKETKDLLKAITTIASNLEHIADHLSDVVGQTNYFQNPHFLRKYRCQTFFKEIQKAIKLIHSALHNKNIEKALIICQAENKLDQLFKENFDRILFALKMGEKPEDHITTLFISQYLERIGDCILNIGEAIISIVVGEKLKIYQYQAVEETLQSSKLDIQSSNFSIEMIGETRSGCRIGKVQEKERQTHPVLFKEGKVRKLSKEKDNIEMWNTIIPGITPKIYAFHQTHRTASLLLEFLEGKTFKDILIEDDISLLEEGFAHLYPTFHAIWDTTKKEEKVNGKFVKQLLSRIEDVYKVHPDFNIEHNKIGNLEIQSLEELIDRAKPVADSLNAPFSVMIHGDCNVDNLIYSVPEKKIYFIDLYRSKQTDYVQDVSVFIVSNFRIPATVQKIRDKLNWTSAHFYACAKDYADAHNDTTFDARLTLGLIRSFITSTRFELDNRFAKAMFHRAIFLLEKFVDYNGPWDTFTIPQDVLVC